MSRLIALALTITFISGCASGPEKPDWIAGNSAKYPNKSYLIGRGQGSSPQQSRDRARADLAKIFQVAVTEASEDIVTYRQSGQESDLQADYSAEVVRAVATRTEQILEGVQIAEQWENTSSKTHHALAVLDRSRAANRLRDAIRTYDDRTAEYLQTARSADELLVKIGAADRAVDAQIKRASNQKVLRIVDSTGIGLSPLYNFAELVGDRDELLARMHIQPQVGADSLGGFDTILAGAVATTGFSTAGDDDANHILEGRFEHTQFEDAQKWYWVRGSMQVTLLSLPGRKSMGTQRWTIKVSAQDAGTAQQRARTELERVLNRDLRATIISFGQPD